VPQDLGEVLLVGSIARPEDSWSVEDLGVPRISSAALASRVASSVLLP